MTDIAPISVYDEFADFITSSPTLQEFIDFRLSEGAQARLSDLLTANRTRRLTDKEAAELDEFVRVDHLIRRTKIRAYEKLHKGDSA